MEIYSFINFAATYLSACQMLRACEMHLELIGYNNRIGDFNLIDDFERSVIDMHSKCRLNR